MINDHSRPLTLTYYQIIGAIVIVLFAFFLRFLVIEQRWNTPDPAMQALVDGTDEKTYFQFANGILDGTFPTTAFYYHPGIAYFLAGLMSLTDNDLIISRVAMALWDSVIAGVMIASGWLLTRRIWAGYLAGTLWATYPMALFYSTTFWDSSLSAGLVALFVFFVLWQLDKTSLWRTIVIGLIGGCIAITRMNLAPILGIGLLLIIINQLNWRTRIIHIIITLSMTILIITPFTLWNASVTNGQFIPVATTGSFELYMGNNRDSAGIHGLNVATDTLDIPAIEGIIRDIQLDLPRMVGLWVYKLSSLWTDSEIGNGYTYAPIFENVSILRLNPLPHSLFAFLSLIGLGFAWVKRRDFAFLLGGILLWLMFSHTITFILSRMRFPVVVIFILLSVYAVVVIIDSIRHYDSKNIKLAVVNHRWTMSFVTISFISLFMLAQISTDIIPKRTYNTLPSDTISLYSEFGDDLTLVGWRTLPDAWHVAENGWGYPDDVYAIELLWQLRQPTDLDYISSLTYTDRNTDGIIERFAGYDMQLGATSFPHQLSSTWDVGTIYGEIVGFRLPHTAPYEQSASIVLGVRYDDVDGNAVLVETSTQRPSVTLQSIATFNDQISSSLSNTPEFTFIGSNGDTIYLNELSYPIQVNTQDNIPFEFIWSVSQSPDIQYQTFIHIVDTNGTILSQIDTAPKFNLLTQNWKPDVALPSTISLNAPDDAGIYNIYMGLYDLRSFDRMNNGAPDNYLNIGTIQVE